MERFNSVFLFVLILLLPTQLGKHWWPEWSLVEGVRVDYLAPTVYLTDILLFLILTIFLIDKLKNPKSEIRNPKQITNSKFKTISLLLVTCYLLLVALLSSRTWLAVYWLARYLEIGVVAILVSLGDIFSVRSARDPRSLRRRYPVISTTRVSPSSSSMTSKMPPSTHLVLIGLAMAVLWSVGLGTAQMVLGRTTEWFWWLGERSFTAATPGVATMTIFGREILRPYATFGHPNALGGFVAAATMLLLQVQSSKFKVQSSLLVLIGIIGVGLTGSRGALAALFAAALLKVKSEKLKVKSLLIILGILGGLWMLGILGNLGEAVKFASESREERVILAKSAIEIWKDNWLFGVEPGQFLVKLPEYLPAGFYKIQPVHNIFLLGLAEFGVIGVLIWLIGLICLIWRIKRQGRVGRWLPVLAVILATGMVDHYWLTAQQNRLLLGIVLGMIISSKSKVKS